MRWVIDARRAQHGFTLIELLVVVLIVGILATIAIPTLVSARDDANDAGAKAMAHDAQVAAETAAIDALGSYSAIKPALIASYDPTIVTSKKAASGGAYLSTAKGTQTTYTVTVTDTATGDKYTIARNSDATLTRTCTIASKTSPRAGCAITRGTKGTW